MPSLISAASGVPRNIRLLIAVCLAALSMPLNFTSPALALTALQAALGGSPVQLNWATNAFMLSFGCGLLAAGAMADTYGRRRMFLTGLCVLGASTLALTMAPGIVCFDLLRGLQGIGCALAFAAGAAALAQVFEGHARVRAFSLLGTSFGIGLAFGPVFSGWMLEHGGWRAVMLGASTPVLPALALAIASMDESRDPQANRLDWPGMLSFTLALALFTLGILQAPASGWSHPWVLAALAGALLVGIGFVVIERRRVKPLLDLSLFRLPRFVGVQLLAAAPAYGFVVLQILLPIRFTGLEGLNAARTGQLMALLSGPMLLVPSLGAWLTRWFSARAICVTGLTLCSLGLYWLSYQGIGSKASTLAPPMMLIGMGMGLPWGLMDGLAVSVVPRERAGMAAGIFNTVRVAGESVAVALVGAGLTALVATPLLSLPSPLHGWHPAQAAQYLTVGNLQQALAQLPSMNAGSLLHVYDAAFATLMRILSAITLASAGVLLVLLREPAPASIATASSEETAARRG